MLLATGLGGSAVALALWRQPGPWIPVLAVVWMICNATLDFNQCLCNALGRMDAARRMMLLQRGCVLTAAIIALVAHPTVEGVLVALAAGSLIGVVASNAAFLSMAGVAFRWRIDWSRWYGIMRDSFPNGIAGLFAGWYVRLGPVMLGWWAISRDIGLYGEGLRIFDISYVLPAAVMGIAMPHLAHARGLGRVAFYHELRRIALVMAAVFVGWILFVVGGASAIMHYVWHATDPQGVAILRVLGVAGGLIVVNTFGSYLMVALGRQGRHAIHEGVVFTVAAALTAVAAKRGGGTEVAGALVSAETVLTVLTGVYLYRHRERLSHPEEVMSQNAETICAVELAGTT
jgi:O-antigen/teichoic acid export membrane protein